MKYLICALHEYPSIAIFLTIAIGFWLGSLRLCSFRLGSEWGTLIALLLFAVGYIVGPQFFVRSGERRTTAGLNLFLAGSV